VEVISGNPFLHSPIQPKDFNSALAYKIPYTTSPQVKNAVRRTGTSAETFQCKLAELECLQDELKTCDTTDPSWLEDARFPKVKKLVEIANKIQNLEKYRERREMFIVYSSLISTFGGLVISFDIGHAKTGIAFAVVGLAATYVIGKKLRLFDPEPSSSSVSERIRNAVSNVLGWVSSKVTGKAAVMQQRVVLAKS